jgi:hypothetical protein
MHAHTAKRQATELSNHEKDIEAMREELTRLRSDKAHHTEQARVTLDLSREIAAALGVPLKQSDHGGSQPPTAGRGTAASAEHIQTNLPQQHALNDAVAALQRVAATATTAARDRSAEVVDMRARLKSAVSIPMPIVR